MALAYRQSTPHLLLDVAIVPGSQATIANMHRARAHHNGRTFTIVKRLTETKWRII